MPLDAPYFADAEAVARALGDDIHLIVPDGQVRARGSDGAILAADPWVLNSALVDFAAQGVAPDDLVLLSASESPVGKAFKARLSGKEPMIAASAVGHALILRHVGLAAGDGQPPGLGGDLTSVRFQVPDLRPQIGAHTRAVRRDLEHDGTTDLADDEDREDLLVAHLAWFTYQQRATTAEAGKLTGDFGAKATLWEGVYRLLRTGLLGRGPGLGAGGGPSTVSARPVRARLRVVPVDWCQPRR